MALSKVIRDGISAENAVIRLDYFVSYKLDDEEKCTGAFVDLTKAFATVSKKNSYKKTLRNSKGEKKFVWRASEVYRQK